MIDFHPFGTSGFCKMSQRWGILEVLPLVRLTTSVRPIRLRYNLLHQIHSEATATKITITRMTGCTGEQLIPCLLPLFSVTGVGGPSLLPEGPPTVSTNFLIYGSGYHLKLMWYSKPPPLTDRRFLTIPVYNSSYNIVSSWLACWVRRGWTGPELACKYRGNMGVCVCTNFT